ncbi:allophanate hydrolase [Sphaerotilus uruguayifluvii]|uniref:Allophanate hydrolase n=1 Tax=Sphaerotilus uruguayifluvii TaxID=2735897 RepID=A0ABX2G1F2_9BURK|nr:allophanate hydrolase [Leptothrix sp. C29]NRT55102.1 allophanate hydrolase [Leptothrix sp. C29]
MSPTDPCLSTLSFDLLSLGQALQDGRTTPEDVVVEALRRIGDDPHHAWISVRDADTLRAEARALMAAGPAGKPLYGIPFAIKDNIDLAGVPTTAGCPAYAYTPETSAFVVQRLVEAGAIPIGKTNLDQFATGLNGTRSPFGACRNAHDPAFVSGGSSSGSAVSVALGQVAFSLGTDTAGSGRVPAFFNHLVGLKPSLGLLSARGVVPACRTLDTVSIFALTADDAHRVFAVAAAFDAEDAYARPAEPHGVDLGALAAPRIGVPRADQLDFCGSAVDAQAWADAVVHARGLGAKLVELDIAPLLETARLLYGGPWVAERYQAIRGFIDAQPDAVFPVTREITLGGARPLAADAFAAQYRLKALQRQAAQIWRQVDALLTPTAPTHPTIEAMLAEPIARNSELGLYTNFMNLLDWAAVAVPVGFVTRPGASAPMPHGVTLCAPAHQDVPLLHLARRWQAALQGRAATLGATGQPLPAAQAVAPAVPSGQLRVAVCGAHLEGQPLNGQLTSRGARLVTRTTTTPDHRLYALPPIVTPAGQRLLRPALVHAPGDPLGRAIEVEVWELPAREFGSFVAAIPAPLGIGKTRLADGSVVPGFICEEGALAGATDITAYGGWRAWIGRQDPAAG